MSVYPGAIPSSGDLPDAGANLSSNPHSSLHDDVRDEVIAIATELGVEPSGTEATVRARLDAGLGLREVLTFDTVGTADFKKSDYPWLRAIRVRVQGGGGGGGGAATTGSGNFAAGSPGGGGVYAESFITDLSTVSDPIVVTVGAGGAGGSPGGGTAGGTSSFGSLVSAGGGPGGLSGVAAASPSSNAGIGHATTGTGDLVIPGGPVRGAISVAASLVQVPFGGSSHLGEGATAANYFNNGGNGLSAPTVGFGGGGGGAGNPQNQGTARTGGAGRQGIVIVELFA